MSAYTIGRQEMEAEVLIEQVFDHGPTGEEARARLPELLDNHRTQVRELIEEKTPKVLATLPNSGEGWTVHHIFFARRGFTVAAQALAAERDARWVDLATLDRDLAKIL